uniref:Uncharacterized protein n=1 Tax=Glossina morsitans morsitans TaxID=37546 RepID=A0A1B0G705_GLOMM
MTLIELFGNMKNNNAPERHYCLGNVIGGHPVLYSNQPAELLFNMGTASLKAGEAVWFCCEISKRFALSQGIKDLKQVFDADFQTALCKTDRLIYSESSLTDALLFTAVSLDENTSPKKLRVENSSREKLGEKYCLVMPFDWFQHIVFEVVVD